MRRLLALAALCLAVAALVPSTAAALTVDEVAQQVRCPTCNTPLNVSSAPAAQRMKLYIAERIDRGWSEQQIIDGLVKEFGRSVLATPPKSGFDLIAWLVPAFAVALGLAAIPVLMRLWFRTRPAPAEGPPPTPEEAARLEEELRRRS